MPISVPSAKETEDKRRVPIEVSKEFPSVNPIIATIDMPIISKHVPNSISNRHAKDHAREIPQKITINSSRM